MIDLSKIVRRGKSNLPPRIVIYGPEGIGKSTFAAESGAVIIPTEDGLGQIECTPLPVAKTYDDVRMSISALYRQEHEFRAVAIDTVDELERIIGDKVAEEHAKKSVAEIPYGKGFDFVVEKLRTILSGLDLLRVEKNMMVIMIAHAAVKRFDDPVNGSYDRFSLKMNQKCAELIKEWCDILGFAQQKIAVQTEQRGFGETSRAISVGGTELKLRRTPSFDAKFRGEAVDAVPFRWAEFEKLLKREG